jgi:hypothetical protein
MKSLLAVLTLAISYYYISLPTPKGLLHVKARQKGTFEIYRIFEDANTQFISKELGEFNKDIYLEEGSYLIFADCSHDKITIKNKESVIRTAHTVSFTPPMPSSKNDLFSVQCSRYEKNFYRQLLSDRFEFTILDGPTEMLVGMVPLFIHPTENSNDPQILEFPLGMIQFTPPRSDLPSYQDSPYFVSPQSDHLAITQPQNINQKQYVLPGTYQLWLNGSNQEVLIKPGDIHHVTPGYIHLKTPPGLDLTEYTKIKGNPLSYEINHGYKFFYNVTYPLLSGPAKIRLSGSNKPDEIQISPGEIQEISLRGVRVDMGCSVHEWECLGKKGILLYSKDEIYPYMESFSDVPIFFPKREDLVSIEGAKGLKLLMGFGTDEILLKAGKVLIKPKPILKHGYLTDLVRMEPGQTHITGFSDDIPVEHPTTLTLLVGHYNLSRYTAVGESDRFITKQPIIIKPGETLVVELPYYVSESKFLKLTQHPPKIPFSPKKHLSDPISIF